MSSRAIEAGKAFLRLLVDDSEFKRGLDGSLAKLDAFGNSAMRVGVAIGGAGAAITAPIVSSLAVFAKAGDELHTLSQRTGLSVQSLSELKFAAQQTGTSLDVIARAARELQSRGLNPAEFDSIAAAISRIEDPTKRAEAAFDTFGKRVGSELLPMIGHIDQLRAQARELGLVMDPTAAAAADALDDAFNALALQSQALASAIGAAVAPAVQQLAEVMASANVVFIEFSKENTLLVQIVAGLGYALTALGTTLATLGGAAKGASVAITGLKWALTALSKHPYLIAFTVAIAALSAAILPLIDDWLGLNEATEESANVSTKAADSQAGLTNAMQRGNEVIDARAKALRELTEGERQWIKLADERRAREADQKEVGDLRADAINEKLIATEKSIASRRGALDSAHAVRARLQSELSGASPERVKSNARKALAFNDRERARLAGELVDLEEERNALIAQRDELTGAAAKKREEQLAADKKARDEQQRHQQELARNAQEQEKRRQEAIKRHAERVRALSENIASQVDGATRSFRGGFGGRFAEQVAGASSAEAREARMLRLTQEERDLLSDIKDILGKGRPLVVGNS